VVVVILVVMAGVRTEAKLNAVDAAALFDLCDRPGTDLWTNCSDADNACINTANWTGITCGASATSIVAMYGSIGHLNMS